MNSWKKVIVTGLGFVFLLSQTACSGGGGSTSAVQSKSDGAGFAINSESAGISDYGYNENYSEDYSYDESEVYDDSDSNATIDDVDLDKVSEESTNKKGSNLNLDMLIYRCDVSIDTLKYQESYDALQKLISDYGGFIESSNYSDNGSTYSYYYIEDSDKHLECSINARIPSDKYEEFIKEFGGIGDIRSFNSNVENVTQEYTDSETALKIYREQEKRYIAMIADADPSYAMQLQNELTELEIKIAQLESRMQNIRNDVAYSYVNITLREVEKYSLHGKTDTFVMRLKDNWSDSWQQFRNFLEAVLTFIIYAWYYVVLIIVIIVLVRKGNKAWRKKHPKKEQTRYYPVYTKTGVSNVDQDAQEETTKTVDKPSDDDNGNNNNSDIDN